jgi:hypothetical protein
MTVTLDQHLLPVLRVRGRPFYAYSRPAYAALVSIFAAAKLSRGLCPGSLALSHNPSRSKAGRRITLNQFTQERQAVGRWEAAELTAATRSGTAAAATASAICTLACTVPISWRPAVHCPTCKQPFMHWAMLDQSLKKPVQSLHSRLKESQTHETTDWPA